MILRAMCFFGDIRTMSTALGLSFCGVCGYMLYRRLNGANVPSIPRITRYFNVSAKCVELIVGRGGHRLHEIERISNARVKFAKQSHGLEVSCIIRGTYDECLEAEEMMYAIINKDRDTAVEIIYVPDYCIGRLLGCNQDRLESIANGTGACIIVDLDSTNGLDEGFVRVTIKGRKSQVHHSKQWIAVVIQEIQEMLANMATTLPRLNLQRIETEALLESPTVNEVCLSAVVNPCHFWVQLLGSNVQKLEELVDEMTEFYAQAENRSSHRSYALFPGDFIAAPYKYDNRYYRARVRVINHVLKEVTVLFVDYGDTETVPLMEIFDLAVKFYQFPFQAIQCTLHEIAPLGDKWSTEAIERFEEWAHVPECRRLFARVKFYGHKLNLTYKPGLTPVIDLYDVVDEVDANIGDLLIEERLAVRKPESVSVPVPAGTAPAFTCYADVDNEDYSDDEYLPVKGIEQNYPGIPLTDREDANVVELMDEKILALSMTEAVFTNIPQTESASVNIVKLFDEECLAVTMTEPVHSDFIPDRDDITIEEIFVEEFLAVRIIEPVLADTGPAFSCSAGVDIQNLSDDEVLVYPASTE